jgi:hypothetical protein
MRRARKKILLPDHYLLPTSHSSMVDQHLTFTARLRRFGKAIRYCDTFLTKHAFRPIDMPSILQEIS